MLTFWTGRDAARIDALFRHSGLMREKWDERRGAQAYGVLTIAKAIKQTIEVYSGPSPSVGHRATPEDKQTYEVGINLTDLGNARRLVAAHGSGLRFCIPWGKWLFWDDQRWKVDAVGEVNRCATKTILSIYKAAGEEKDKDRRKALVSYALKCESQNKIRAMMELAKTEPGIPILPEQMDLDPWLLNVANGTIDLRTGDLRPHNPKDYITKLAPVPYLPETECPSWKSHISTVMAGNAAMIQFLQKAYGYSLTGITDERVLFIPYGLGANGKSTTQETIASKVGDYGHRATTETFVMKRLEPISSELAAFKGKRFVYCSEIEQGKRLKESLIKDMCGGDTLRARFLYSESFEFQATFKLWLATNHKPIIHGTDPAIWDRIRLIPFTVSIPPEARIPRRDMDLAFQLEAPGILAWLVKGCLEWHRNHQLGAPLEVVNATAEYRQEMDLIGEFLAECCSISPISRIDSRDIYKAYTEWAIENHEKPLRQNAFGRVLTERGFIRQKCRTGDRQWTGICLKDQNEELIFDRE